MSRTVRDKERQRALQQRTLLTRERIVSGVIEVLATGGVSRVTHRAVAKAAGVSLAATTYHFASLSDILAATSEALLADYLAGFRRLADRLRSGDTSPPQHLEALVELVVENALGRDQTRSLAWSELMLHGARDDHSRTLAANWYRELDEIWQNIERLYIPNALPKRARSAVDLAVGMTMTLRPLGAGETGIATQFEALDYAGIEPESRPAEAVTGNSKKRLQTRQALIETAIAIIADEGTPGLTFGRLAEAAGMVRSGPSYYFASMADLLAATQNALFGRAKQRYRAAIASSTHGMDADRLIDLTTTIFLREVMEFGRENVSYYALWLEAVRNPTLAPAIGRDIADLNHAWQRRLAVLPGQTADARAALRLQALFTGKLLRAVCGADGIEDLSSTRADFAALLTGQP